MRENRAATGVPPRDLGTCGRDPALGSGPPTAEGRDGRQRGLTGRRHLGCGRLQSLSRAVVEDGPSRQPCSSWVRPPGKLILPCRLVAARYAACGGRDRSSARSLSEHGFPGYGECQHATGGVRVDRVGVNPRRLRRSTRGFQSKQISLPKKPLTCDCLADGARKGPVHPPRDGDIAKCGGVWKAQVVLVEPIQLQKSTNGTWPVRLGEQPVRRADLAHKGCA